MKKIVTLALALLLCLTACGGREEPEKTTDGTSGATEPRYEALYADILADYSTLVDYYLLKDDGSSITLSDTLTQALRDEGGERTTHEVALASKWNYMLFEMARNGENLTRASFGYILRDINGDEIPELFWLREDRGILAVFTVRFGCAVLLDAFWPRYSCVLTDAGELYTLAGGGNSCSYDIRSLTDRGALQTELRFGTEGVSKEGVPQHFQVEDGRKSRIDEARFEELITQYPFKMGDSWLDTEIIYLQ